jgi:UDP-N-acetyl-D-glucosamine dehydrogenase
MKAEPIPLRDTLLRRLRSRDATVAIVGMGYVGLPLALRYAGAGYRVLAIDVDPARIEALNASLSYLAHVPAESIAAARRSGLQATGAFEQASRADAIIICVPTPLNAFREPDLSHVRQAIASLVPHLRHGQVISLESTTYPGTTEEELRPLIEARGFAVGRDIFVCYSPERENPGSPEEQMRTVPKVCGGVTAACLEAGVALYEQIVAKVVAVSSTRVAEMTKLLENIHRAVNIALVNETKIICDRMGIDVHEVIRAAATKPFGFVPYWPGPGMGGHCIPVDPFYLTWKARQYGIHTRFVELAGEINRAMPHWVLQKLIDALNERGRSVKGSRCLVLGAAYKKNVDDTRESPALELIEQLARRGAIVDYSDPHVPELGERRSVSLSPQGLAGYDVVLLATDHDAFDYAMLKRHAKLIVDTRGVYLDPGPNVVKA